MKIDRRMKWNVATTDRAVGSMAGDLLSDWISSDVQTTGHTLAWTDAPVGVFFVNLSNDGVTVDKVLTAADFSPALAAPAGSASRTYFEIVAAARFRQIGYTRTSGTGSLSGTSAERVA